MSYSEIFVVKNNLLPGDAILLRKKFAGMLDHFAVYLGRQTNSNEPLFAANYTGGIKIIMPQEASSFLQKLNPEKIERFIGSSNERRSAVKRAISMVGNKSYNLITNNCEHYKNFVQFGVKYSKQVDNAANGALVAGGVTAIAGLASKSKGVALLGLALLAFGGIAKSAATQEE